MKDGRGGSAPDFVGIGAQKAGTTWLHHNLEIQRGVWVPPVKELHFFNRVAPHEDLLGVEARGWPSARDIREAMTGRFSRETFRWLRRYHLDGPTIGWYRDLFPPSLVAGRISGEITPAYSTLDARGVRFARKVLRDGCRVFFVIRNPIERAWSALKMHARYRDDEELLGERIDVLLGKLDEPTHRLRGDYVRTIELWQEYFGSDFKVFLYDDLKEDPGSFLSSVLTFVGADGPVNPERLEARSNPDPAARRMPAGVRERLVQAHEYQIRRLDDLWPGIAALWLE